MRKLSDKNSYTCYSCGSTRTSEIRQGVRDNADLNVLQCNLCSLVFLSSFEHITEKHYAESGMHAVDNKTIQQWLERTRVDDVCRSTALHNILHKSDVLDFGCGAGGFLIRIKHIARSVTGIEPERRLYEHFAEHGVYVLPDIADLPLDNKFDCVTVFHTLEHMKDPIGTLRKLGTLLQEGGRIVIEVPNVEDALLSIYDCEAFAEHTFWSNHLFYFSDQTITDTVRRAGLEVDKIKQVQRYGPANHLYWLAKGKPNGDNHWSHMNDGDICTAYRHVLKKLHACDTLRVSVKNK